MNLAGSSVTVDFKRAIGFLQTGLLVMVSHCAHAPNSPASAPSRLVRYDAVAMGTQVSIVAWMSGNAELEQEALSAAFHEIQRLEERMTTWPHPGWPKSDITALNEAAGLSAVPISRDTLAVLAAAVEMGDRSGGVFDITFAPLTQLWRFDEDMVAEIPAVAAIAQARKHINFRALKLTKEPSTAHLPAAMQVSLGGIAKGYAVDAAARVLHASGVHNFLIQAGGDLFAAGKRGNRPWTVGIRDPRDRPNAFFAKAPIEDHAFSTSGDYERAFVLDGQRYHHILDPRTGYPSQASRSVTVFAPTAMLADALGDAVFILGPQRGMELLQSYPGAEAVIVDSHNKLWVTAGLMHTVEILYEPTDGV